jgi:hypothetical protein
VPAGSEAGRRPRCPGVGSASPRSSEYRHGDLDQVAARLELDRGRLDVAESFAVASMWRSEGISERPGTYSGVMLDGEQLAAPLLRERPGASIPSGAGAVRRLCAALRVLSAPHRARRRLSRATRRRMSRTIMGGAASILREGGEHGEHR